MFGRFFIPEDHIFYRSPSGLSAAFVNLRPIVPGHVLVVPQRVVDREKELDEEESLDLWKTVREVGHRVEEEYKASALNIAVQDGKAAGQSVPHVHFHILPRAVGDFERNDDVYDKIEEFDARPTKLHVPEDSERKDRTFEEMKEEAGRLRRLFAVNT
ncbi:hypothetical protein GUITHDRAFT_73962 [Guillardia theta CCMP2712]|uniref:HIT domain-containing protein n=2 Tax=Guillardia theta TaxID=55529 RepID=L1J1K0_GUITC|nr:hypothetical protein GUITHDRAFT_73962 [Guillardia theta CCMP2712]EKX42381.1 hypothetical protein GUITHDRAFT_73962 [Guillardia theta CCMP2712]|eukprot:XP_005829361.1 hypothetical protein GUITHDRAFT_73962 [Guillardia theta CCMP2712]